MTPPNPSDLVLPPGTRSQTPKAIPSCPACQTEFTEGQLVIHFIGAVAPGAMKTAPIHFGCALATVQAQAEDDADRMAEVAEDEPGG